MGESCPRDSDRSGTLIPRLRPHRAGDATPISWARAASRLRLLQFLQLSALVLLGVATILAAMLVARDLRQVARERDRADQAYNEQVTVRDDLRTTQNTFYLNQARRPDVSAVTPEVLAQTLLAGGRLRLLAQDQAGWVSPEVRRSADETIRSFDRVVELAQTSTRVPPTTPLGRARLAELDRLVQRLNASAADWLRGLEELRNREDARLAEVRDQLVRRIAAIVALLLGAAILLWLVLDRARNRIVLALRAASDEQQAQGRLATAAAEGSDLNHVAVLAADESRRVLDAAATAVAISDAGRPNVLARMGDPPAPLHAALARAIATGESAFIDPKPGRREGDPPPSNGSVCLAVPVVVDGERWGALGAVLASTDEAHGAEPRLRRVATTMALAVASVEARRRLTDQATSDPLTGLANHRAFHEELGTAIANRADRLALVLLDIDHFKAVNDGLGHQAGDEVLAEVARRLIAEARDGDIIARVGGEEFAWLMPGADGMQAFAAAERARVAIRSRGMGRVPLVTISAGVATTEDAATAAELIRLADSALYWAKSNGRDLTCRWSQEITDAVSDAGQDARLAQLKALAAIQALARAVDARDPFTFRHSERVAELTHRLALTCGWHPAEAALLREAALLHDVGKVGVPDAVLLKPGALTDAEYEQIKLHAPLSAQIVAGVLDPTQVGWVRGHHERFDGRGYPDGLAGEDIPAGARIMAVADAWDAMTSDRPYRAGRSAAEAYEVCLAARGTQLCPRAVDALTELWTAGRVPEGDAAGLPNPRVRPPEER